MNRRWPFYPSAIQFPEIAQIEIRMRSQAGHEKLENTGVIVSKISTCATSTFMIVRAVKTWIGSKKIACGKISLYFFKFVQQCLNQSS